MSRPRVVVLLTTALFLLAAAVLFAGPLTRERTPVASTGTPPPFGVRSPILVRPGQELCAEDVLLSSRAAVAELVLDQGRTPAPPLSLTVRSGDRRSAPVAVPGGGTGVFPLRAPFTAPSTDERGSVCLRNDGRVAAQFVGTEEFRTMTGLRTTVDGQPVPPDVALNFYEGSTVSVMSFLPRIIDYMTAFRGFLGAAWILWPLLVLVVAGVPLAVLWAFSRALEPVP